MDRNPGSAPGPDRPADNDDLDGLPERAAHKAAWLATRPPEERTAWLADLRRVMGDFPHATAFIAAAEKTMAAAQAKADADIKASHTGEQLEANAATLLENLLSGEVPLPESLPERAAMLLFIAATGHQFEYLHQRLQQADAAEFLEMQVAAVLRGE